MSKLIESAKARKFIEFRNEAMEKIQTILDRKLVEMKREVAQRYDSTLVREEEDVSELSKTTLHSYQSKSMADSQSRMKSMTSAQSFGNRKMQNRRAGRVLARLKSGAPKEVDDA